MSITELAWREFLKALHVTLGEEFDEQKIGPVFAQIPPLNRVADVGQVERILYYCQLVIIIRRKTEVRHSDSLLQSIEVFHVHAHVGGEDAVDHQLANAVPLGGWHLHGPVILRVAEHQLESGRDMM